MGTSKQKKGTGDPGEVTQNEKEQIDLLKIIPITPKARAELEKLSPTIQQFLLRFLDYHDDELIEKVIKYIDRKNVLDSSKLVEDVGQIMIQNQKIYEFTESTNKMVLEIKEAHEKRLIQLEEDVRALQPDVIKKALNEWEKAEPKLERIMRSQKHFVKIGIAIIGAILITITVLTWHIIKDKPVEPLKVELKK